MPYLYTVDSYFQAIKRIDKTPIKPYYAGVETTRYILSVIGLILLAIFINLPLGYLRQNCRKFSFAWYFYVHISIPVIIYLRIKGGYSWRFIPLTLMGAFAGQFIGGYLNKRRKSDD
jgi:hypothetical protein